MDDNRFLYHFADHNIDGTYIHVPKSLVGAYKGGVEINNHVWTITDQDGSTRKVNAGKSSGYITNVAAENGPFFDMVPTNVGGSNSTHYSDYYSRTSNNSIVLARSCDSSSSFGGVAFAYASYVASSTHSYSGSRLAFRGTISEVVPKTFKNLPVL